MAGVGGTVAYRLSRPGVKPMEEIVRACRYASASALRSGVHRTTNPLIVLRFFALLCFECSPFSLKNLSP